MSLLHVNNMTNKRITNITFETYQADEALETDIKQSLEMILDYYNCRELTMPIFTCLNELLGNAIKANYKNLYFENYAPKNNALEVVPYHVALKLFKMELSSGRLDYLRKMAARRDVKATVEVSVENDYLTIKISNPVPLSEQERNNILTKMEDVEKYDNLSEYFNTTLDDPMKEGAGLGIMFIGMMLQSLGLSPDELKIFTENRRTIAKVSIPLNEQTVQTYMNHIGEENDGADNSKG